MKKGRPEYPLTGKRDAVDSNEEYIAEFERRVTALHEKFAIELTPYDELVDAMNAIETELNRNGGANWTEGDHDRYLDIIEEHLTAAPQFSSQELEKIGWALGEIAKCGEELERKGESGRYVEGPIEYLIARVVDWCRSHERRAND